MNQEIDTLKADTGEQSPDEGIVCSTCLTINPPRVDYCAKCAAPLSALVAYNPFDQTLIEGFAYRRAVDGPPSKVVLIGIWLLFGPPVLSIPFLFWNTKAGVASSGAAEYFFEHGFIISYAVLSVFVLYRVTTNFISKRKGREAGVV